MTMQIVSVHCGRGCDGQHQNFFMSMPNFVQCNQDVGLRDVANPTCERGEDDMGQGVHLADKRFCGAMKRRLLERDICPIHDSLT